MKYIYGPVPSRRLGLSLGVDIVPYKTCAFDCIYCQLGRTTNKTIDRCEYFKKEEVLDEIKRFLSTFQPDYITFSGSGEPTLNSKIGWLIKEIKKVTQLPVAVLTNGSLLYDEQVREDLLEADLVVPSLDAANEELLEAINRPHSLVNAEKIWAGLKTFRKEYKGRIWVEVMLVKGINDSLEHIRVLKSRIKEIKPDKVQLNTVVRPPAEDFAYPLSTDELEKISEFIGDNCEVIAGINKTLYQSLDYKEEISVNILALVKRRPMTLSDISSSLGIHKNEVLKYLNLLEISGKINCITHAGLTYYKGKT